MHLVNDYTGHEGPQRLPGYLRRQTPGPYRAQTFARLPGRNSRPQPNPS